MTPTRATGRFDVTGIGQAVKDLEGVSVPMAGEIRVDGIVMVATIHVKIGNALVGTVQNALAHPLEQIPLYRPELIRLSINKA
jgi:hypothetical protein